MILPPPLPPRHLRWVADDALVGGDRLALAVAVGRRDPQRAVGGGDDGPQPAVGAGEHRRRTRPGPRSSPDSCSGAAAARARRARSPRAGRPAPRSRRGCRTVAGSVAAGPRAADPRRRPAVVGSPRPSTSIGAGAAAARLDLEHRAAAGVRAQARDRPDGRVAHTGERRDGLPAAGAPMASTRSTLPARLRRALRPAPAARRRRCRRSRSPSSPKAMRPVLSVEPLRDAGQHRRDRALQGEVDDAVVGGRGDVGEDQVVLGVVRATARGRAARRRRAVSSPVSVRTVGTGCPARGCTRTMRPVVRSPTSAVPSGSSVSPTGAVSFVATTSGSLLGLPGRRHAAGRLLGAGHARAGPVGPPGPATGSAGSARCARRRCPRRRRRWGSAPKSGAPDDAEQPASSSAVPTAATRAATARRDMIPSVPRRTCATRRPSGRGMLTDRACPRRTAGACSPRPVSCPTTSRCWSGTGRGERAGRRGRDRVLRRPLRRPAPAARDAGRAAAPEGRAAASRPASSRGCRSCPTACRCATAAASTARRPPSSRSPGCSRSCATCPRSLGAAARARVAPAPTRRGSTGRRVLVLGAGDIGDAGRGRGRAVFDAEVTLVARRRRDGVRALDELPDLLPRPRRRRGRAAADPADRPAGRRRVPRRPARRRAAGQRRPRRASSTPTRCWPSCTAGAAARVPRRHRPRAAAGRPPAVGRAEPAADAARRRRHRRLGASGRTASSRAQVLRVTSAGEPLENRRRRTATERSGSAPAAPGRRELRRRVGRARAAARRSPAPRSARFATRTHGRRTDAVGAARRRRCAR